MSSLASGRSLSPGKEDPARIWGLGLSGEGTALPGFLGPGQDRTLAVLLLPVTHVLNGHGNDKRPFSASVPSQTPPSILTPLQPAVQKRWPGWWLSWLLFHSSQIICSPPPNSPVASFMGSGNELQLKFVSLQRRFYWQMVSPEKV